MAGVAVVSDSTSYLPPELVERHGIHVVPLYVVFGGDRTVPETDITDYDAFFEELRAAEHLPTTSQPSVGDFTSVYEPLLADGGEVVSVHISGGLSGTVESARQAAETLEREGKGGERVHVYDSTTAAGGLGLLVLAAAAGAAAGQARRGDRRPPRRGAHRAPALVLDRHARVPPARRPDRRRQRLDRLDAAREADPHGPERDGAGGARAHQLARVRADGRLRPPVPRLRRGRLVRAAHQRARAPRAADRARARDLRVRADRGQRDRARARHAHGPGLLGHRARSRSASFPEPSSGGGRTIARCASRPPGRSSGSS